MIFLFIMYIDNLYIILILKKVFYIKKYFLKNNENDFMIN